MKTRILTDSTCDLPAAVIQQYGIYVLPIYINVGSQSYLDGIDLTREEFYRRLPGFPAQPKTAVPSLQKFAAMYQTLAGEGAREVISIHISASLSALCGVAQSAAQEVKSTAVTVFDSRQLSLGTGFLVETAAKMAQAGCSAAEILPALSEQVRRTHVSAALDTLEYLRRSGRMNGVISTIGQMLQIKPLLSMYDGVASTERVRTRRMALERLQELLRAHGPFERLAFLHSGAQAQAQAQALMQAVSDLHPTHEVWVEQLNPVLGTHIGPGAVGFIGVSSR